MTIYSVIGETPELKDYATAVFVISDYHPGVFGSNELIGFCEHPTIKTESDLKKHLQRMEKEGFTVKKYSIPEHGVPEE